MKNNKVITLIFVWAFLALSSFTISALTPENKRFSGDDTFSAELRPFDFSDKYYGANGIEPALIFNRRNGQDKLSVFDTINDEKYRQIRVTATSPAYNYDGSILFWNLYGELFEESFSNTREGKHALEIANYYPIFAFPSASVKNTNRQAHLIDAPPEYFEKNPLGLGVVVLVEYTQKAFISDDYFLNELAEKNGLSLDGTPIIRSKKELEILTRQKLVTQRVKGFNDKSVPPYAIAPVIKNPLGGAIAPDAFLMTVLEKNGKPLDAENFFVESFECLQMTGRFCKR